MFICTFKSRGKHIIFHLIVQLIVSKTTPVLILCYDLKLEMLLTYLLYVFIQPLGRTSIYSPVLLLLSKLSLDHILFTSNICLGSLKIGNDIDKAKLICVWNKCLITTKLQPVVVYQSVTSATSGVFDTVVRYLYPRA